MAEGVVEHRHIHITGIVQGVGFRPFVYREAVEHGIAGWVLNAGDGVHIEAAAEAGVLDAFTSALRAHAPAASQITGIEVTASAADPAGPDVERRFRIVSSEHEGAHTTLVSPDIATCPDCLRELFDPRDRRYHYPFINCTNCGPRFTIIDALPYDRANTSMRAFPMCPTCAAEYANPLDRRFHAQPDACFVCGPHITWRERAGGDTPHVGATRATSDAIIARCAQLLAAGGIVAIKGLGGFHLACDAASERAVRELRRRKRRSNKPLAIMVADVEDARRLCLVSDAERALLAGTIRPIVLLRRRMDETAGTLATEGGAPARELARSVAFDLPELGVMLPYTPLQHLLLAACREHSVHALVMTSGNVSEEPIEIDDELAWQHLVAGGLADALLGNDRAILTRFDDSVVRVAGDAPMLVRRARGYAPRPLDLPGCSGIANMPETSAAPAVLACGAEQKATLALTREAASNAAQCLLSQHIGDIEHAAVLDAWHEARRRMEQLFDLEPTALACDLHPAYLTSQWARSEAARSDMPLIEVQHHHAHIASVIAEAAAAGVLEAEAPVIGIALDGTGAGTDGSVWGGELMVATLAGYTRVGHLRSWRLPGGAASVRDARRCALSLLMTCELTDHAGATRLRDALTANEFAITHSMVERGIASPATSSMGRLLDALAAITGACLRATYEGEPAIELEAAAWRSLGGNAAHLPRTSRYRLALAWRPAKQPSPEARDAIARVGETAASEELVIDPAPLLAGVLDDLAAGVAPEIIALHAHIAIADALCKAAARISERTGIQTIALSGGVFMNRLLCARIERGLRNRGLTPLLAHTVPANDGCIAYGQAAVARARLASFALG